MSVITFTYYRVCSCDVRSSRPARYDVYNTVDFTERMGSFQMGAFIPGDSLLINTILIQVKIPIKILHDYTILDFALQDIERF